MARVPQGTAEQPSKGVCGLMCSTTRERLRAFQSPAPTAGMQRCCPTPYARFGPRTRGARPPPNTGHVWPPLPPSKGTPRSTSAPEPSSRGRLRGAAARATWTTTRRGPYARSSNTGSAAKTLNLLDLPAPALAAGATTAAAAAAAAVTAATATVGEGAGRAAAAATATAARAGAPQGATTAPNAASAALASARGPKPPAPRPRLARGRGRPAAPPSLGPPL
jgi:hypothetical protein